MTELAKSIDEDTVTYLKTVKDLKPEQRAERLKKINHSFTKSREYGDDKVQLAMQTYEMVRGNFFCWKLLIHGPQ